MCNTVRLYAFPLAVTCMTWYTLQKKTGSACPVTHWLDWSILYEKWPTYQGKHLDNTLAYCHHKQVKWTSKCNATRRGLGLQRHINIWGQMQKIIGHQNFFGYEKLLIFFQCLIHENHCEIWYIYPDISQHAFYYTGWEPKQSLKIQRSLNIFQNRLNISKYFVWTFEKINSTWGVIERFCEWTPWSLL